MWPLSSSSLGEMVGVKALVDGGIYAVPVEYLNPKGCRHGDAIEHDEDELPVVDLSGIESDESKRRLVIDAVHRACQEWGFFQLVGHGIPSALTESMNELVHYFFNMPLEERIAYYSEDKTKSFRFGTSFNPLVDKTKHWQDYLFQTCNPPPKDEELPNNIPSYKKIASDYSMAIDALARKLLAVFSECLGLEPSAMEERIGSPPRHTMRMNYYPPCPSPELAVGLDGHSDPGAFTILQQDGVAGLQVLHNGSWVTVKPLPGAFVINIADQIQILTNGKYKSVEHRALVNTTKTRVSIASFYSPLLETYIAPMAELLGEDAPLYRGCKFGDYLHSFLSKALHSKSALAPLKISPLPKS